MSQDQPSPEVFLVINGQIVTFSQVNDGDQMIFDITGAGVFRGDLSNPSNLPHSTTIQAVTTTHTYHWTRAEFLTLVHDIPELSTVFLEQNFLWHAVTVHRLSLASQSARVRLAHALYLQSQLLDEPIILVGRNHLAKMTGLTHFTVSRIMADMKREGILNSGSGWYQILQAEALTREFPYPQISQAIQALYCSLLDIPQDILTQFGFLSMKPS